MKSPEYGPASAAMSTRRPAPKQFEAEYFQYLTPESFTVLPPDENIPLPSVPPKTPEPNKLTPRKRRKNQAFAIIAVAGSANSSRSGSPTGRVSPFRGRGFNSTGSRHVSPAPSPPPFASSSSSTKTILRKSSNIPHNISHIPISIQRRSSADELLSPETSPTHLSYQRVTAVSRRGESIGRTNLNVKHSRSMTNITPRKLHAKPPASPSPRRVSHLKTSFLRLSPIIGSSPEATDQLPSSPSRIPRSKSQPPSRLVSPNVSRAPSRGPSRNTSRAASRNVSRNASRETSPNQSPTKIPIKNSSSAYKNIPAKMESFARLTTTSKPKVPQKPKVYSTRSNVADRTASKSSSIRKNVNKPLSNLSNASRTDTLDDTETTDSTDTTVRSNIRPPRSNYSRTPSKASNNRSTKSTSKPRQETSEQTTSSPNRYSESGKTSSKKTSSSTSSHSNGQDQGRSAKGIHGSKIAVSRTNSSKVIGYKKDSGAKNNRRAAGTSTTEEQSRTEDDETTEDAKDDDIISVTIDSITGTSTTQIVSATTETVVKPLNISSAGQGQTDSHKNENPQNNNTTRNASSTNNNGTSASNDPQSGTASSRSSSNRNQNNNLNASNTGNNNNNNNESGTDSNSATLNVINRNINSSTQQTPVNGSISAFNNSSPNSGTTQMVPDGNGNGNIGANANHVTESLNNNVNNHVSNSVSPSNNIGANNHINNLTPPDSDKVSNKTLLDSSANQKLKQARTVIVDEIKPIQITVREKSGDVEVQSGNITMPRSATNGIAERPLLSSTNGSQNSTDPPQEEGKKNGVVSKLLACCKRKPKEQKQAAEEKEEEAVPEEEVAQLTTENEKSPKLWDKICCKKNKVGDSTQPSGCFPSLKRGKTNKENWAERRDSILSEPPKKQERCAGLKKFFCMPCSLCRKKPEVDSISRRQSMMSKKKSLSSTMQPPPEDTGPKLDPSLVEFASHMRGAIPILPVPLAWICLICNVFLPGIGTILSGLLCLCIGIPRFSPRDSFKARFGAFLIDVIVGISQLFTVLFCLVGWGWSIWWGTIMLKIAKKYRKIKKMEANKIEDQPVPSVNVNHTGRDVERGN